MNRRATLRVLPLFLVLTLVGCGSSSEGGIDISGTWQGEVIAGDVAEASFVLVQSPSGVEGDVSIAFEPPLELDVVGNLNGSQLLLVHTNEVDETITFEAIVAGDTMRGTVILRLPDGTPDGGGGFMAIRE